MRLFDIDAFFKRVAMAQIRHRSKIIVVMAVITVICLAGLTKFTTTFDKVLLGASEEQLAAEARFKEIFSTDSILVLLTADDVFAPEVLHEIDVLGQRLEREIPASGSVYSLLTMPVPIGSEDEIEVKSPFDGRIPDDKAELERIKSFFLSRES